MRPDESTLVGSVAALFRYPVKSMQGEAVASLTFIGDHAIGDRGWALIDVVSGLTLSAKRWGQLLEGAASTQPDGGVIVTLPDASQHDVSDPRTTQVLSEWLDRRVELRQAGGVPPPFELLSDATDDDSPIVTFAGPRSHWADLADAHFLTSASLRAAKQLHPQSDWDIRRFRPTALVDGLDAHSADFEEDAWVGSKVTFGESAAFEVFTPAMRCSLPTRPQPGGLPRDLDVARVLRDRHDFSFGVYAALRHEGTINAGDPVQVAPRAR
jgi:uncharacterized protein